MEENFKSKAWERIHSFAPIRGTLIEVKSTLQIWLHLVCTQKYSSRWVKASSTTTWTIRVKGQF
jgi:hypothetical protein